MWISAFWMILDFFKTTQHIPNRFSMVGKETGNEEHDGISTEEPHILFSMTWIEMAKVNATGFISLQSCPWGLFKVYIKKWQDSTPDHLQTLFQSKRDLQEGCWWPGQLAIWLMEVLILPYGIGFATWKMLAQTIGTLSGRKTAKTGTTHIETCRYGL